MFAKIVLFVVLSIGLLNSAASDRNMMRKCDLPAFAPERVENIIDECQVEIKAAILKDILEAYSETENIQNSNENRNRTKRDLAIDKDEQHIAGCLLQCVYGKVKALDTNLLPIRDGLIDLYTNGIDSRFYFSAVSQSVDHCLRIIDNRYRTGNITITKDRSCDIAYNAFECVSNKVGEFCGQTL